MAALDKSSYTDAEEPTSDDERRPSPAHFAEFLPWACSQLGLEHDIIVNKVAQSEYVSAMTDRVRAKPKRKSNLEDLEQDADDKVSSASPMSTQSDKCVRVVAIHDSADYLLQIKFIGNKHIPRAMLKIISLILKFHPHLYNVTISGGLDMYTTHELSKFLPLSRITDICLDNSWVREANYHILLEHESLLRYLSLARCKIDDAVVKNIAITLAFPLPASKSLVVLNLSSNKITDVGVKYLAAVLRANRKLSYLNLANNMITDEGAADIFNVMLEFRLTYEETKAAKARYMAFLKMKVERIFETFRQLKAIEFEKRAAKKKPAKTGQTPVGKKGKLNEDALLTARSVLNMDPQLYDKAEMVVQNSLGSFNDPFDSDRTLKRHGVTFSHGNNTLCYLNLAYNSLSFVSLKKLLRVLAYQKLLNRRPRGLINVSIEGNYLPVACRELSKIDDILEIGLMTLNPRMSMAKRSRGLPSPGKIGQK